MIIHRAVEVPNFEPVWSDLAKQFSVILCILFVKTWLGLQDAVLEWFSLPSISSWWNFKMYGDSHFQQVPSTNRTQVQWLYKVHHPQNISPFRSRKNSSQSRLILDTWLDTWWLFQCLNYLEGLNFLRTGKGMYDVGKEPSHTQC